MKIGDYVRTKYGIAKCIKVIPIRENSFMYEFDKEVYEDVNSLTASELEKYKSSPNIIDLIEVGDFVTYKNSNFYFNIPTRVCGLFDELTLSIVKMVGDNFLNEVEITSIVTKEQFESMEYKIGGKE